MTFTVPGAGIVGIGGMGKVGKVGSAGIGKLGIEMGNEILGSDGREGGVGCFPAPPFGNSIVGN